MHSEMRAAPQVAIEQQFVDTIYGRLDVLRSDALGARDSVLADSEGSPADRYRRDAEAVRRTRRVRVLTAAEHSLCIGRIDYSTNELIHIGRIGVQSEEGRPLLVDWRADAARPFYAATYASPLGLRRRRHLRLTGRVVVGVTDEILDGSEPTGEDMVGDGPLLEALGRARTGRMREAVATLQAEQDAVVRSQQRGVTVVEGGPGTGKTIVALHRAAYVLYSFPDVTKQGLMVFGPNRTFLEYISAVLPSLGENDVQMATMADLVGVDASVAESYDAARLKGQARFAAGLAKWVRDHQAKNEPLRVRVGPETLIVEGSAVYEAHRRATRGGVPHNYARATFKENIAATVVQVLEAQTANDLAVMDAELAAAVDFDLDQAVADDLRSLGLEDTFIPGGPDIDWDRVHDVLLEDPAFDRAIDRVWPRLRASVALREFLTDPNALATYVPGLSEKEVSLVGPGDRHQYSASDLALLDEARFLIDGPPDRQYGHIVVDEAQELSEMEWRAIMRRCPGHSMTIVGDLAQAGSATTIRTWVDAVGPFVGRRFDRHTLTVNYRTTAEILDLASPLLRRIAPDQLPSRSIRHGDQPRMIVAADRALSSVTAKLVEETQNTHPGENVGVVVPVTTLPQMALALDKTLAVVLTAPDVRGMEFDYVIVVDPGAIVRHRESGERDLYVALTRATKRLLVVQREC